MMGSTHTGGRLRFRTFLKAHLRSIILLMVLLLFLYAVVPQIAGLGQSFSIVLNADKGYIALAFLCWAAIYLIAAVMYMILAVRPIRYFRTLEAQLASGFSGKLLPSGLGVVGLFVQYLRRHGHTLGEAVAVASLNNATAVIGHILLLAGFFIAGVRLPDFDIGSLVPSGAVIAIVVGAAVALVTCGIIWRQRVALAWKRVLETLTVYRRQPGKVVAAVIVSIPQTFAYMGVLYASALALGVSMDFTSIFMIATFSMLVGTLIPVPGGIVGAEAGLTAGFVAYGLTVQEGLAIALLYRAFIYWLPILPGLLVFIYRRRDYL